MNKAELKLELIERGEPSSRAPLLFVHGYWQAAWAWDVAVTPALSGEGHHCLAFSFRGHGESPGRIRGASIHDYVEDLGNVVSGLEGHPVIIAHSMGAFVTQHYLAKGGEAAAVALVSPVPRSGAWGATLRVVRRHPYRFIKANATLDVGAVVETRQAAADFLVADDHQVDLEPHFDRLERASYRTYLDLLLNLPKLSQSTVPAVVIGGTEDAFFSQREWRRTARALGAELVILDGIGHQPMWERGGADLIRVLRSFLADASGGGA